jgi:hypothetical protein
MITMTRKQAELNYNAALKACRAAEAGADEAAWMEADSVLTIARSELVEAEAMFPTAAETKRAANKLYLRNRGFDC